MIEKINVCKSFLLSKIYYIANFMIFTELEIKELERMLHQFIWDGNIERISRGTLILRQADGGLDMMSIRARLKTILFQNFVYIVNNTDRACCQMSIYWL